MPDLRTHQTGTVTWGFGASFVGNPIHLRPSGLRPVRARASASAEYSYNSMSHKYFISFSRVVLASRGSNGLPLTSSSASHSSGSFSSASTAKMSGFGGDGRCCRGSQVSVIFGFDCNYCDIALMIVLAHSGRVVQ